MRMEQTEIRSQCVMSLLAAWKENNERPSEFLQLRGEPYPAHRAPPCPRVARLKIEPRPADGAGWLGFWFRHFLHFIVHFQSIQIRFSGLTFLKVPMPPVESDGKIQRNKFKSSIMDAASFRTSAVAPSAFAKSRTAIYCLPKISAYVRAALKGRRRKVGSRIPAPSEKS